MHQQLDLLCLWVTWVDRYALYSLIMCILSQTEHASDDGWFGEAGRDKTASGNNTGHRMGPGVFLYLEGCRLDWKGKNAVHTHIKKNLNSHFSMHIYL